MNEMKLGCQSFNPILAHKSSSRHICVSNYRTEKITLISRYNAKSLFSYSIRLSRYKNQEIQAFSNTSNYSLKKVSTSLMERNAIKIRKRNYKLKSCQVWYSEAASATERSSGEQATPRLLAKKFPTSRLLAIGDHESVERLQANIRYWIRIQRGKLIVKDAGLIDRVDSAARGTKRILNCPLANILCNPRATNAELENSMERMNTALDNRLFIRSKKGVIQKRLYWGFFDYHIFNSIEFLAYQLILARKMELNKFQGHKYFSLKEITLLLLRILMTTPLIKMANTILETYFFYVVENQKAFNIKPTTFSEHDIHTNPLPFVIDTCLPIAQKIHYMESFDSYKTYHRRLLEYAQKALTEKYTTFDESMLCNANILYWADRYSDLWLACTIEKIDLFDRQKAPWFNDIYNAFYGAGKRHQIW